MAGSTGTNTGVLLFPMHAGILQITQDPQEALALLLRVLMLDSRCYKPQQTLAVNRITL